ncbi:MAG: hypothetical protein IH918_02265 [Acidobacteria bacterium]|nr:hypothetical protein [Acidobacteriota bacterium]
MTHRDHRFGGWEGVVGECQTAHVRFGDLLPSNIEHVGRSVGGNHCVPGVDQVSGQPAAATSQLQNRAPFFEDSV